MEYLPRFVTLNKIPISLFYNIYVIVERKFFHSYKSKILLFIDKLCFKQKIIIILRKFRIFI
jgi:hypothetical protein